MDPANSVRRQNVGSRETISQYKIQEGETTSRGKINVAKCESQSSSDTTTLPDGVAASDCFDESGTSGSFYSNTVESTIHVSPLNHPQFQQASFKQCVEPLSRIGDDQINNSTLSSVHECSNGNILLALNAGKTFYQCGFCGVKLSSNKALLDHVSTHTDCMAYRCSLCSASFVEATQLGRHMQLSHEIKAPYQCGLCSETFHLNAHLQTHVDLHNETQEMAPDGGTDPSTEQQETDRSANNSPTILSKDELGCECTEENEENPHKFDDMVAPAKFTTIIINQDTNLKSRKEPSKIVMDDIDLSSVCTVMVEPSSAGGSRKKHLFKCNYCEKIFKDKSSLVSHARTHTKGRPYECRLCPAKFRQYAHLHDHVMTKHTSERPFVCDRCAKSFTRKCHLQDHIRLRHTDGKLFHCPQCLLSFQKRSEFSQHRRTHDKIPKYSCNFCPRQFHNVTDYERHIRTHTKEKRFECEICHLTFGLLANAKKHMIKHNKERPFKCDVCPKAYHLEHDLKRHLVTHTIKKPFPCLDCYKSFKTEKLLQKHTKISHTSAQQVTDKASSQCLQYNKKFSKKFDLKLQLKLHEKINEAETQKVDTCKLGRPRKRKCDNFVDTETQKVDTPKCRERPRENYADVVEVSEHLTQEDLYCN